MLSFKRGHSAAGSSRDVSRASQSTSAGTVSTLHSDGGSVISNDRLTAAGTAKGRSVSPSQETTVVAPSFASSSNSSPRIRPAPPPQKASTSSVSSASSSGFHTHNTSQHASSTEAPSSNRRQRSPTSQKDVSPPRSSSSRGPQLQSSDISVPKNYSHSVEGRELHHENPMQTTALDVMTDLLDLMDGIGSPLQSMGSFGSSSLGGATGPRQQPNSRSPARGTGEVTPSLSPDMISMASVISPPRSPCTPQSSFVRHPSSSLRPSPPQQAPSHPHEQRVAALRSPTQLLQPSHAGPHAPVSPRSGRPASSGSNLHLRSGGVSVTLDPFILRSTYTLTQSLTMTAAKTLASGARHETVPSGQPVFRGSAAPDHVAVVLSGAVSVSRSSGGSRVQPHEVAEALTTFLQCGIGSESERELRTALRSASTTRSAPHCADLIPSLRGPVMVGLLRAVDKAANHRTQLKLGNTSLWSSMFDIEAITPCEVAFIPFASVSRLDDQDLLGIKRKTESLRLMFIHPLPLPRLVEALFSDNDDRAEMCAGLLTDAVRNHLENCGRETGQHFEGAEGASTACWLPQEPAVIAAGAGLVFSPSEVHNGGDAEALIVLTGRVRGVENQRWPFVWPDVGSLFAGAARRTTAATDLDCLKVRRSAVLLLLNESTPPDDFYDRLAKFAATQLQYGDGNTTSRATPRFVALSSVAQLQETMVAALVRRRLLPPQVAAPVDETALSTVAPPVGDTSVSMSSHASMGTVAPSAFGEARGPAPAMFRITGQGSSDDSTGSTAVGRGSNHDAFSASTTTTTSTLHSGTMNPSAKSPFQVVSVTGRAAAARALGKGPNASLLSSSVSGSVSSNWLKLLPKPNVCLEEGSMLDDGDDRSVETTDIGAFLSNLRNGRGGVTQPVSVSDSPVGRDARGATAMNRATVFDGEADLSDKGAGAECDTLLHTENTTPSRRSVAVSTVVPAASALRQLGEFDLRKSLLVADVRSPAGEGLAGQQQLVPPRSDLSAAQTQVKETILASTQVRDSKAVPITVTPPQQTQVPRDMQSGVGPAETPSKGGPKPVGSRAVTGKPRVKVHHR